MRTATARSFRPLSSRVLDPTLRSVHFPHRCALWKPTAPEQLVGTNTSGLRVADSGFTLAASYQSCFYAATPETDAAKVMGRTINQNVFSLDIFLLPECVDINDGWVLLFLTPGDNWGRLFTIHGAPQSETRGAMMPISCQQVYGRNIPIRPDRSDPLPGVSVAGMMSAYPNRLPNA